MNVENKIDYLRRNELVPVKRFLNLDNKNVQLLKACDADMDREHYNEDTFISELFKEDKAALLPLPCIRFDTARYTTALNDKYGKLTLENRQDRYSASPAFCVERDNLKITSAEVIVRDDNMHEVVRHRRKYGQDEKESMNWLPYLKYIARKPRSLRNSGIYDIMPETMRQYMNLAQTVIAAGSLRFYQT